MKTLYIIRHAKSDRSDHSLNDFQRPLNKRGKNDLPFMGEILAHNKIHPDLIVSSPATRAQMTAYAIALKLGYDTKTIVYEDDLYGAGTDEITDVLKKTPPSMNTVFIVGHNPGLTLFAEYISGYEIENIPTCGIFCVQLKHNDWQTLGSGSAEFVSFDYPKKYKND